MRRQGCQMQASRSSSVIAIATFSSQSLLSLFLACAATARDHPCHKVRHSIPDHLHLFPCPIWSSVAVCRTLRDRHVPAKHHQNRGSECCHGCVRCFRDCCWCGFFNSFLSMCFCMCPGFVDRGILRFECMRGDLRIT